MVASDRISAFDYVLRRTIPDKGRILTAMTVWWFDQLADLVPNHLLALDDPAAPAGSGAAGRWCAGRWRWCRSRRSPAATSPARGCSTTAPPARCAASRCRPGLRRRRPAARADLHAGDEGRARRARRERRLRRRSRRPSARETAPAAARADAGASTARGRGARRRARHPARRHQVRVRPRPATGRRWCSATRCSPRTRRGSGRPTSGSRARAAELRQAVRARLAAVAGLRLGPRRPASRRRRCPTTSSRATRARYVEAYERLTGLRFADWPG